MPSERLKLIPGVDPSRAREVLKERIQKASNIGSSAGSNAVFDLRNAYVIWVDETETYLRELTYDREILTMLDTPRYHSIRTLGSNSPRPWPLVQGEIALQTASLERLLKELAERVARSVAAPGHVAVLDTHALLHYQPPTQIPWIEVIGEAAVRLVLPLRVVEELDAKKYARREDLAGRARSLLRQLKEVVGPAGVPAELQPDVTIEILLDSGPRYRPSDADEEILMTCSELAQFGKSPVCLVTADTAMQIRAEAQETSVVEMPDSFARKPEKRIS